MRKLFALVAALALCFTVVGCGKDACEEAADKILDCWNSMDCSSLGAQAAMCESLKQAAKSGGSTDSGGSCDGQAKAAAEQINACTLDPQQMCTCKQ